MGAPRNSIHCCSSSRISRRYCNSVSLVSAGSIVIATNRPFREWGKLFDVDNTLATALINRLMHHGEGIIIQGDSFRMKDKTPDSTDE